MSNYQKKNNVTLYILLGLIELISHHLPLHLIINMYGGLFVDPTVTN